MNDEVMVVFSEIQLLVTNLTNSTQAIDAAVGAYKRAVAEAGVVWTDLAGGSAAEFDQAHTQFTAASQQMIMALGAGANKAGDAAAVALHNANQQVQAVAI